MKTAVFLIGSFLALGSMLGQESKPQLLFKYTATAKQVPSYTFRMLEDGSGGFTESVAGPDGLVQESTAPLRISAKTTQALLAQTKAIQDGGFLCASKAKGIANTGIKVLEVGGGSCTYNFSEDKAVVALTNTFQAMALTLDEGRKLAFKIRFDRLGLNDEMMILWDAVKAGRAVEMGNIAGILTRLANDDAVLARVRERAADLLRMAE